MEKKKINLEGGWLCFFMGVCRVVEALTERVTKKEFGSLIAAGVWPLIWLRISHFRADSLFRTFAKAYALAEQLAQ